MYVYLCVCVCVCVFVWNMKAVFQCSYDTGVIRNIRHVAEGFYKRKELFCTSASVPKLTPATIFCQVCREALNRRMICGTKYAKLIFKNERVVKLIYTHTQKFKIEGRNRSLVN